MRTGRFVLGIVVVALLSACAASRVVQSWVRPDVKTPSKVMVFGVTKEEGLRRFYEDRLSQALTREGLQAVPSYDILKAEGEVEQRKVAETVSKAGADGVFITRLVRLTKRLDTVPVPGPVWGPPFGPYGGFYSPYWPTYYYDSYRVVEREFAYVESNLYATDSSELLMSILTRTQDPNYSEQQVVELVDLIVKEFRKNGLLAAAAK
jgi:hypothetical protein